MRRQLRSVLASVALMAASVSAAGASASRGYLALVRDATDLLRRDLPRQAEEAFAGANYEDYSDPLGWLGLAAARLAQGDVDRSLEHFAIAAELGARGSAQAQDAQPLARLGRAVCLLQRGQVAEARQGLAGLEAEGFPWALPCLAYAELAAGANEGARERARSALEQFPDDPLALAVAGKTAPPREGIGLLRRALDLCPGTRYAAPTTGLALPNHAQTSPVARDERVRISIADGPPRRATVTYEGDDESPYIILKFDGQQLGMSNTPPHQFGLPQDLAPGAHGLVAEVWVGRKVAARGARLLWSQAPGEPPVRYGASEYLAALEGLRAALTPIPNRAQLHYWLGAAYVATGERLAALRQYEWAVALDPGLADARQRLITLTAALGRTGATQAVSEVRSRSVCLTFDDGPHPMFTGRILEMLRAAGVRATFFVVGTQARAYPDLLRAIAQAGHEIANHSYSHDDLSAKSAAQVQQELLRTQVVVEDVTGQRPRLFRPPGGRHNAEVRAAAAQVGYTTVLWSANVSVCAGRSPAEGVARLLQDIRPGSIVLLHNGPDETVNVLPGLLAALKKRGYSFATVSQALGREPGPGAPGR